MRISCGRAPFSGASGGPVFTGHNDGLITINIAEADDPFREKIREQLGEAYRTLLGVFESVDDATAVLWEVHDPAVGDGRIILLCAQGFSSSLAARRLQELGFDDATDVIGGFEAWAAARLPITPPDPAD